MTSYILLIALVLLVLVGILRASKQERKKPRQQREPNLGVSAEATTADKAVPDINISAHLEQDAKIIEENAKINQPPAEHTVLEVTKNPLPVAENSVEAMRPQVDTQVEQQAFSATLQEELIDFIVIYLFTDKERHYRGYDLLQSLLTAGLRYGKKGIFHRHEDLTGRGAVLFSLAQALEPGTFDLPKMGSFTTPGLIFFMMASQVQNPLHAFDVMLNTIKDIQKELSGNLYDEKRQPLTADKITQLRNCLKLFSGDD